MHTMILLFVLYVLLQIADAYLTARVIGNGGVEVNPVMVWLNSKIGFRRALIVKTLVGVIAGYVVYLSGIVFIMVGLVVFYIVVVGHNYNVVRGQEK